MISEWSLADSGARIFLLDGMAGTGKSAIARSVCHRLSKAGLLGGSFFCSRGTRDDVTRIIPTLAEFLARQNRAYRQSLLDILQRVPDVSHHTMDLQITHLLVKPFRETSGHTTPMLVFVVDALDECSDPQAIISMIRGIISNSPHIPFKFFLTSRPEQHIRSQFRSGQPDIHNIVRLHDIDQHIVEQDIRHYCTLKLRKIQEDWAHSYDFPQQWPSETEIACVTKLAGKLFIYAFTAMQFIAEENPVSRLQGISRLDIVREQPLTVPLDKMYSLVLDNALNPELRTRDEILGTNRLLAVLLTLRENLTISKLSDLIGMATQEIKATLGRLHAVVYIPTDDDQGTVTMFHASFEDYLTTPGRAPEPFRIDLFRGHEVLACACIQIMASTALYFNVSGCRTSYLPNSKQSCTPIPILLAYSCLHWVHHLIRIPNPSSLLSSVNSVLRRKTLFWLEVLSASGNARLAVGLLHRVLTAENTVSKISFLRGLPIDVPGLLSAIGSLPSWPDFCEMQKTSSCWVMTRSSSAHRTSTSRLFHP